MHGKGAAQNIAWPEGEYLIGKQCWGQWDWGQHVNPDNFPYGSRPLSGTMSLRGFFYSLRLFFFLLSNHILPLILYVGYMC